jgi:hypothetical protein
MRTIGSTKMAAAGAMTALLALAGVLPANAISRVQQDPPLVQVSAVDVQTPSNEQIVELADRSMRAFMTSVREKSMQGLWQHISPRFRAKYSVAQLDETFKAFYGLAITGDPLAGKSPIFSSDPLIQGNGSMVVDGFYATTPWRVSFHLVYAMEGRDWKLIGINVSAKPPSAPGASRSPEPSDSGASRYQTF